MSDITNPRLLWFKGGLFLLGGTVAATLILLEHPTARTVLVLVVALWCFCRAYYFAFYVVEKYIDSSQRFAGLTALVRYALRRRHD